MAAEGGRYLKRAHRHNAQNVAAFDTLEAAVTSAKYGTDDGAASFDYIEDPDGRQVDAAEVRRIWEALDDREEVQRLTRTTYTHRVVLDSLVQTQAAVEWATSAQEAERKAERWRAAYGSRVSISEI